MYIAVRHEISDPQSFWGKAAKFAIPPEIRLLSSFPNNDGSKGNCLWEADSIDQVESFIESNLGEYSKNEYFEVNTKSSVGI